MSGFFLPEIYVLRRQPLTFGSISGQMQLHFHGVMKESDDLDHVVVCHTIEHDMARAFDRSMGLFGLLA